LVDPTNAGVVVQCLSALLIAEVVGVVVALAGFLPHEARAGERRVICRAWAQTVSALAWEL
jgi:hypothetical protein